MPRRFFYQPSSEVKIMAINIDEMLDLLSFAGTERANGNANHGPMAAEALFTMGRSESVLPWVEKYKTGLIEAPEANNPIPQSEWRNSLGDRSRLGDWIAFFDRELSEKPWQDTLREWVPPLTPAVMAAATHGLLRTSHAVRSLSSQETPHRLHELAQGLGYWAARYQVLPGSPSPTHGSFSPSSAVAPIAVDRSKQCRSVARLAHICRQGSGIWRWNTKRLPLPGQCSDTEAWLRSTTPWIWMNRRSSPCAFVRWNPAANVRRVESVRNVAKS